MATYKDTTYGEVFKRLSEKETMDDIARSLDINRSTLRDAIKRIGYVNEGTGHHRHWVWKGEGEEPLNRTLLIGRKGKKTVISVDVRTNERTKEQKNESTEEHSNERTNVEKNESTKERSNVGTNEQKNEHIRMVVRKRASLDIDVELLRELKIESVVSGQNIYEIVEEAIRKHLAEGKRR